MMYIMFTPVKCMGFLLYLGRQYRDSGSVVERRVLSELKNLVCAYVCISWGKSS